MPEIPRTKFNSPWTVAVIEAALNDVSSAKGSSESLTSALNAMRAEINSLSGGVHLKGAVDYYNDLPASPSEGDAYTVRYQGTSGTDPLGIEYAWATYQGTPQWIPIGVDPSVFAKQAEMDVVANAGAKNVLPITNTTSEVSGITFTVNADGTVTTSGTLTSGVTSAVFEYSNFQLPAGAYTYTCEGAAQQNVRDSYVQKYNGSSWDAIARDYENNTFTLSQTEQIRVRLRVYASGTSGTFKPMIRPAEITDSTFQPYAKTNRELTVAEDEDRAALAGIVDGGDKNKLLYDGIGAKQGNADNIDFTYNADGSITVNGSVDSTGNAYVYLQLSGSSINVHGSPDFCTGGFVLSGCPSNNSGLSLRTIGTGYDTSSDTGDGVIINPASSGVTVRTAVMVAKGNTVSNLTVKPMICTTAAWQISHAYQPYRPSWQEMYDMILALQSGGNRALTMQMQQTESTEPDEPEEQEER